VAVNKQGWPSPFAVHLRHCEVYAGLGFVFRIQGLAVHDDLLRRIAHFTNGALPRNEGTKIVPFGPKRYPVPVRVGKWKVIGPNTHPRSDDGEIVRSSICRAKVKRAVGTDVRVQQSPGINKPHARPELPLNRLKGIFSLNSEVYKEMAIPSCRWLDKRRAVCALFFAFDNADKSRPARIAIMVMTTRSSISVNPAGCLKVVYSIVRSRSVVFIFTWLLLNRRAKVTQ